jgi:hypothetical protein
MAGLIPQFVLNDFHFLFLSFNANCDEFRQMKNNGCAVENIFYYKQENMVVAFDSTETIIIELNFAVAVACNALHECGPLNNTWCENS